MLRVHQFRLTAGEAEHAGVEHVVAVDRPAGAHIGGIGEPSWALPGGEQFLIGQFAQAQPARHQVVPEFVNAGSAGKPSRHADYRDCGIVVDVTHRPPFAYSRDGAPDAVRAARPVPRCRYPGLWPQCRTR